MYETLGLGAEFSFRNSGSDEIFKAITDMNKLYDTASRTGESVDTLGKSFDTFTRSMQLVGMSSMFKGLGLTVASAGAIMKSSGFEEQFTGILKYMSNDSAQGMREFNEQLSNTAKYLGITKQAVMGAAQEYMAMGLAQEQAIEMARSVSYAGKVWDVLPQEAATAFKGIAASYQLDFLDEKVRTEFIDLVNTVADYTALTGQDTLNFLSAAGAGLKLIGRTDMDGAMGIAAAARRAEVDITHLGYGMRQITKTYAEKGDKIFANIGVNVRDAQGSLKPFDQALAEASTTIKNYSQDVQAAFAMDLGQRYSDDLLRVLGGWNEYDKTMQIIANGDYAGSAEAEWQKITNTFGHNANITKVIWNDFIQATFGSLLPTLTTLLKPLNEVFGRVTSFLKEHPLLGKFIASTIMLTGVVMLLGGAFFFLGSRMAIFLNSVQQAGGFTKLFTGALKGMSMVVTGLKPTLASFGKQMLGMGATFGAIYLTWKYDIFGIRSALESFVSNVKYSFERSRELIKMNAVEIKTELGNMDVSNNFVDRLTAFFTRIQIAWDSIVDLFNDYTISDEMYDKLVASGMEPTVTSFIMLVYRMRRVWTGFKKGFSDTCDAMSNTIKTVLGPPFVWLKDNVLIPVIDKLKEFGVWLGIIAKDSSLVNSSADGWENLGNKIGMVASSLAMLWVGKKIIGVIGTVGKGIGAFISVFGKIGGLAGKILSPFLGFLGKIGFAFKAVMGGAATLGEGIGFAFGGIISKVATFIAPITGFFGKIGFAIKSVIGGAAKIGEAFAFVFPKIAGFVGKIAGAFTKIGGFVMSILGWIGSAVIAVLGFFGIIVTAPAWVVGAITVGIAAIITAIVVFWDDIVSFFGMLGSKIGEFFTWAGGKVGEFFTWAGGKVGEFFSWIGDKVGGFFSWIGDKLSEFGSFIGSSFGNIKDAVVGKFIEIKDGVGEKLLGLKTSISTTFTNIKSNITTTFSNLKDKITQPFKDAWSWITGGFMDDCKNVGTKIMDTIGDGITNAKDSVFGAVKNAFSWVSDNLFPHSNAKMGPFSDLTGSGKSIPTTIAQGVKSTSGELYKAISGMEMPSLSTDYSYNVNRPNLNGLNLPQLNGDLNMMANVTGVSGIGNEIVSVFVDIFSITKAMAENFKTIVKASPYMDNQKDYTNRVNNVYNNRYNDKHDDKQIVLKVEKGAFEFKFENTNKEEMINIIPQLKEMVENCLVDAVNKLKDEAYER